MPIEGGWWTYTLERKRKTCPECGGSGKDNATLDWKCCRCKGLGMIKEEDKDDDN